MTLAGRTAPMKAPMWRTASGLAATLFLLTAAPATSVADLAEGIAAYNRNDYQTALRELLPAARRGNPVAQAHLGVMSQEGQGVPQDYAEAVKWYRLAAQQGNAAAELGLGYAYFNGRGVPQDYAEAMKWYRRAAGNGSADAQHNVGLMYTRGYGVPQDYAEAVKWYHLAAEQGHAWAQFGLGVTYGLLGNDVYSHLWFNLAASRLPAGPDRDAAVKGRDLSAEKMTPPQIAEAQRLAREWKPKLERRD